MTGRTPVDATLFTWPSDRPQLRSTRCYACGWQAFPLRAACPRCASADVGEEPLPRTGTIWSFTTQEFPLKEPYAGPPGELFALGYVELGGLKVEGRLDVPVESARTAAAIGTPVELVIVPFGDDKVTYAFRPQEQSA